MEWSPRTRALLEGGKVDRVPIHGQATGFNNKNAGYTVASAYDDPQKAYDASLWAAEQYDWELIPHIFSHSILGGWDFGGDAQIPESEFQGALSISRHPVRTEGEVWELQMPDPKTAGAIPKAMEFAKLQRRNGELITFFPRSPFCIAANICGVQQFCRWMLRKPELCESLLRMAIEHIFNVLQNWIDAFGAQNIFIWMSSPSESNQIISARHFEKFAFPYHVEFHERLRPLGVRGFGLHICGEQNKNLPYFASARLWEHPSILSFGHEVDLEVAAGYFPEDIIFGNIEPAIIQTGTPQQVYDLSRKLIEKGKRIRSGFIFAPGCELPVQSPPVNVYQMTKAIRDCGWY
jgi:uroporphyrinogen decarboxylase